MLFFKHFGRLMALLAERDYPAFNPRLDGDKWDHASDYLPTSMGASSRSGSFASLFVDLRQAMKMDGKLKFFTCAGKFDLRCSINTTRYCQNHTDVSDHL